MTRFGGAWAVSFDDGGALGAGIGEIVRTIVVFGFTRTVWATVGVGLGLTVGLGSGLTVGLGLIVRVAVGLGSGFTVRVAVGPGAA
ncbi:hypothetical protein ACFQX6_56605 [Streptosporangium lutulentum]